MAQGLIKHTLSDWILQWTLPDGITEFVGQKIELDLAGYDQIQILFGLSAASERKRLCVSYITGRSYYVLLMGVRFDEQGSTSWYNRSYTASDTGVSFANGYSRTFTASGAVVENNARCIPYWIRARKII